MTTARHSQGTQETALPSTTKESQALCRARAAVLFVGPPSRTLMEPHAPYSLGSYVLSTVVCARVQ